MAYLQLIHQTAPAQSVSLASGEISLGRAPDNDVAINDVTASQYHARIFTYFYVSYIEDLNSTNGTFVNGKQITKHILRPGDVVALGKYEMIVAEKPASVPLRNIG